MKTNDQIEPTVFVNFGGAGDLTWLKTMFDLLDEIERLHAELRFLRNH